MSWDDFGTGTRVSFGVEAPPPHLTLDPHQVSAVAWLLAHPRGGLADEMRVGKTAPAIRAAVAAQAEKVLVVCPAVVVSNWKRQIRLWATEAPHIHWTVVSYHRLGSVDAREGYDTVIFDECHYLKTPTSQRTQQAYGSPLGTGELVTAAVRVWLLSGTLMPNHAGELWTHFKALFGEKMSYTRWIDRYVEVKVTPFGIRPLRNKRETIAELRTKVREHFRRMTFAEVHGGGDEPLVWNVVALDGAVLDPSAMQDPAVQAVAEAIRKGRDPDEGHVARLRRLVASAKADVVIAYLKDLRAADKRTRPLVLAYHRDLIARVAEAFSGAVTLTGSSSPVERDRAIAAFQSGEADMFVGQINACGTGIDLSRATCVVMAEQVWNPGDNIQVAMRAVNRAKRGAVPVDVLTLADTIDDAVTRVRLRKMKMIRDVMDHEDPTQETP